MTKHEWLHIYIYVRGQFHANICSKISSTSLKVCHTWVTWWKEMCQEVCWQLLDAAVQNAVLPRVQTPERQRLPAHSGHSGTRSTALRHTTRHVPMNAGSGHLGRYPRKPSGPSNKNQQKPTPKPNCTVLFSNKFYYFEVLKPISRILLSILDILSTGSHLTMKNTACFISHIYLTFSSCYIRKRIGPYINNYQQMHCYTPAPSWTLCFNWMLPTCHLEWICIVFLLLNDIWNPVAFRIWTCTWELLNYTFQALRHITV